MHSKSIVSDMLGCVNPYVSRDGLYVLYFGDELSAPPELKR
jgi:hypothetical protein